MVAALRPYPSANSTKLGESSPESVLGHISSWWASVDAVVAGELRDHRRQVAAGAVTGHRDGLRRDAVVAGASYDVGRHGVGVVEAAGKGSSGASR